MIEIAYSPCPNDTFCFDAWVNKKIYSPLSPSPILADIQQLNTWAYEGRYPVTKVSSYCLGNICKEYRMLPSGAAISHTGPKLIGREPTDLDTLKNKTIAIPGLDTTAYLLFRALFGPARKVISCRYEEVPSLVINRTADIGLIIHETRFLFHKLGLVELADLGTLFYSRYNCPVPLGVIATKRTFPESFLEQVSHSIEHSVRFALLNPKSSQSYVLAHSQEKEESIIEQHIQAYVNQETVRVSTAGLRAISTLFELAIEQKLLPREAMLFL
jgi:1,4-dihydroxy-6-naphthoate synthase